MGLSRVALILGIISAFHGAQAQSLPPLEAPGRDQQFLEAPDPRAEISPLIRIPNTMPAPPSAIIRSGARASPPISKMAACSNARATWPIMPRRARHSFTTAATAVPRLRMSRGYGLARPGRNRDSGFQSPPSGWPASNAPVLGGKSTSLPSPRSMLSGRASIVMPIPPPFSWYHPAPMRVRIGFLPLSRCVSPKT